MVSREKRRGRVRNYQEPQYMVMNDTRQLKGSSYKVLKIHFVYDRHGKFERQEVGENIPKTLTKGNLT